MSSVLAIRHLAFEDLGLLEPLLTDRGHDARYLDAGVDPVAVRDVVAVGLVVVLGGPIGAHDEDRYPFLADELDALRARLAASQPTLGICLGAQLMARALGAEVAPSGRTEIGYAPLTLTAEAQGTPLRHLAGVPVLHWHNDTFDIPSGAVRLASTEACANQAYARGADVLGLQFHLETPAADLERWLIGHAEALTAAGIDARDLRRQAVEAGDTSGAVRAALTDWLRTAGF
ncbi:MAG TPA: glutamine amidotransferase [Solirubrobacteraceae bacterium]|nr:glutamine amidotransferase [Solirubrobacteraceae bacterium]